MKFDAIIIGGGVIGLATARTLAQKDYRVAILEAADAIGQEMSFRNSAVLHAGIYYPRNSLKAKLCLAGKPLLENYCKMHHIPHKKIGKLIVAVNEKQQRSLEELFNQATHNGVEDLEILTTTALSKLEPEVSATTALLSPATSIIDGQQLINSFVEELKQLKVTFFLNNRVTHCDVSDSNFYVKTASCEFASQVLINAAGLGATDIAQRMEGLNKTGIPKLYLAKGNYFRYLKASPFNHLIYPLPETAGLGIHATLDLKANLRFGPDVEWIETISYLTSEERKATFVQAIKEYFPKIAEQDLIADHSHTGIRPKILPADCQPQDFMIHTHSDHQIKGLVNLFGIESPGLTSCLAIAEYVKGLLMP